MRIDLFWKRSPGAGHEPRHLDETAVLDQAWTFVRPQPVRAEQRELQDPARWADVDECWEEALERATRLLRAGKPGRARYELARAAERCSRMAAEGTPSVPPTTLRCVCAGWVLDLGAFDPACAAEVHGSAA